MKGNSFIQVESWEKFDVKRLFSDDRNSLHTNELIKIDKKDFEIDNQLNNEESSASNSDELPKEGDKITLSNPSDDTNHVDKLYQMEDDNSLSDSKERDVQADKETDLRKEEPSLPSEKQEEKKEPVEEEGTDNPIQKESEGIDEVAEATSKTSEDVHGGDEATKDIENSPNAANNGMNENNHGAEEGLGDGEIIVPGTNEGNGSSSNSESNSSKQSEEGSEKSQSVENDNADLGLAEEDWEKKANELVDSQYSQIADEMLAAIKNEKPGGARNGQKSTMYYSFEDNSTEMERVFKVGKTLLEKFLNRRDILKRISGNGLWNVKKIAKLSASKRLHKLHIAKEQYEKKISRTAIVLDISASCYEQSEMFLAIGSGVIQNPEISVYVGYNGDVRMKEVEAPKTKIHSYKKAKKWLESQLESLEGWGNSYYGDEDFCSFLEKNDFETVIIFGDWDGRKDYEKAAHKFRQIKLFWFSNQYNNFNEIPEGFTRKNYIPDVFKPWDFIKALKKI